MGVGFVTRRAGTLVKDIAGAEVTLDFSSVTYDGSEKAPKITRVELGGTELRDMQDYYAVITRQQNAGDYNIIVNGIGEYGGVKQVPWHITKAAGSIRVEPAQVTIQGATGTTATVNIISTGDGEITVSQSRYVTANVAGKQITLTSVEQGSDTLTVTLGDGQNYTGSSTKLNVEVQLKKPVDNVLEENDWATIAEVAASGEASQHWKIGDTKTITIGSETYHAQIIGFNHDDLDSSDAKYNDASYNGGKKKAAITFQMKECLTQTYRMDETNSNSCSWRDSEMRVTTMPIIKGQFDQSAVAVMRTVTKSTAHSQTDSTIYKTADVLFLLCHTEVFDTQGNSHPGEGTQYAFYAAANDKIKKNLTGSAVWWWLRSPSTGNNGNFRVVSSGGITNSYIAGYTSGSVAAGFCV